MPAVGSGRPPAPDPAAPVTAAPITTAPPRRAAPTSRTKPRPSVLIGLAAALVLVAGATFFIWRYLQAEQYDSRLAADRSAARQVTERYLGALRDADAATALDVAAERPGNDSLLTDEALRTARDNGGVTGIRIGEATIAQDAARHLIGDTGTVAVHYLVGGSTVDVALPVSRVGSHWKLAAVTARVDLGGDAPTRTVDGTVPATSTVDLFPGSYRIGTTSPLVTLAQSSLVVTAPDPLAAASTQWSGGSPGLSTQARSQITDAARESLSACLGQQSLTPPGCPIAISTGASITVDPATIQYTLLDDPWAAATVAFDPSTGGATGKVSLHYRLDASATNGDVEGVVRQEYRYDATFAADLSGSGPVISWK